PYTTLFRSRSTGAPCPFEDIRQHEHRHVAPDAVTLAGDLDQLADYRLLCRGVGVVELHSVRPSREVRVAAVGQEQVALLSLDPGVVLRRPGQVQFRPANV